MKFLLLLLFCSLAVCQSGVSSKKDVATIPMESVDIETNGKRAGGTHFRLDLEELFLDYQYFDDINLAGSRIDNEVLEAKTVLERSTVAGLEGDTVGKLFVVETESKYPNAKYCLLWTNKNKFTQVCSESLRSIEEFRNTYQL